MKETKMYGIKENIDIKNLIYEVRGKQVMLDSDLAKLYEYSSGAKALNQAVKRNIERFPDDFCFKLTKEEYDYLISNPYFLRSQIVTANMKRALPYVFTEEGVAMLSGIIKTNKAALVNVEIMRAFVRLRHFTYDACLASDISVMKTMLLEHSDKIEELFDKFDRKEDFKSKLFFDGEIYDAYSLLVDIISKANKEIIIIDNFVDKVTLDILSKKKVNVMVLLITDENKSKLNNTDINKFNSEYPLLRIKYTNAFHDRFIIIDNKELYHLGASLKDLGKKVFGITKIEDKEYLKNLIERTR